MIKIPKPKNNTINEKLSIPYYSNVKFLYKNGKKNNSKTNISTNLYNDNLKKITLKKVPRPSCHTPIKNLDAYEKAEIESAINAQLKSRKYQNILLKDREIKNYLHLENNEIKKDIEQQKMKLKEDLTKIIKDSLSLAKNTYKTLNLSMDNRHTKKSNSKQKNIDFLSSIGISIEPLDNRNNNINVNIDKTWNYVNKISKGKNKIDDILRYKIVNNLMVLTGKKRNNILNRSNSKKSSTKNSNNNNNNKYIKINLKKNVNNSNKVINEEKNKMNHMNRSINIPFNNNRHRMIEIINRSYNLTTNIDDKNDELKHISKTEI